jgi:hypothetical protein
MNTEHYCTPSQADCKILISHCSHTTSTASASGLAATGVAIRRTLPSASAAYQGFTARCMVSVARGPRASAPCGQGPVAAPGTPRPGRCPWTPKGGRHVGIAGRICLWYAHSRRPTPRHDRITLCVIRASLLIDQGEPAAAPPSGANRRNVDLRLLHLGVSGSGMHGMGLCANRDATNR